MMLQSPQITLLDIDTNEFTMAGVCELAKLLPQVSEDCRISMELDGIAVRTVWYIAGLYAPIRRAFFTFFAGVEVGEAHNVAGRFGSKDGDGAIRKRVLKFLTN